MATTVKEQLIEYANRCLNDIKISEYEDYISCKKHKQACQRMLRDFEKEETNPEYPFYWNEEEAQNIVDWFALLRHSKGVLTKKPIILTIHQKFSICQLYGWRRKDNGLKRFKKWTKFVARKNAKSQELAGINLYEISVSSTKNDEVYEAYTAGTKREQSKKVYDECPLMLVGSPLRTKFKITRDAITHIKTGSYIKPLCKDDGKSGDGSNPAILTLDEYHQHKTTEFYDLFLGANVKDPTLVIITTAGVDLTYPCYTQEYAYITKLLDPDIDVENDSYFADVFELDKEDYEEITNIDNRRLWIKANPIRMSYPDGRDKIEEAYKVALVKPEEMTTFLTKCLDVWVQAKENGYMDMGKWKKCQREVLPIDTTGMSVYVGFDMSAKIDLTSVAFVIPFKTGGKAKILIKNDDDTVTEKERDVIGYVVYSHSFIPNRAKLAERISKDKVPYDAWERQGYLTVTDTEIVDQATVMRYVMETCAKNKWHIESLCFDPANAAKLMMDLSNMGYTVEEVFQSHKSLNESTSTFRECVYTGEVYYLPNPLLNYAMSNAVIRKNNGLIKIDKDATTKRIDPVDALLCAFKLALYHSFEEQGINDYISSFLDNVDF